MARLDRLGWAAGLSFVAYGVRIGIRVNDPRALQWLPGHLPPGWRPSSSPGVELLYSVILDGKGPEPGLGSSNLLYAGPSKLVQTAVPNELYEALESSLALEVAEHARGRLFVHAGVVSWRERAIVIPGRSRSGKSTLVEALVRAGATYYSDEYAVFDPRGWVHPYPRPLSIRESPGRASGRYPVEALGGSPGSRPLQLGLVIVTHYQSGARWRPRRVSDGQAVLALFGNAVSARSRAQVLLLTLKRAVATATTIKGRRDEAREVAPLLLDELRKASLHSGSQRTDHPFSSQAPAAKNVPSGSVKAKERIA